MFDYAVVHYSEIGLKGGNRPLFERRLAENIRRALDGIFYEGIERVRGRILIKLSPGTDLNSLVEALGKVFGIAWFALASVAAKELDEIKRRTVELASEKSKGSSTFKIFAKRADKDFPAASTEIARAVGFEVAKELGLRASMEKPDLPIYVDIAAKRAFIYFRKHQGPRGLPVGVTGRVLALLSGGIDSPVAAWMLMKRGCTVDYLHFHAYSSNEEVLSSKIIELVAMLACWGGPSRLVIVPYYPFQMAAIGSPPRYELVLFRRFMFRMAERVARELEAKSIATGESLAQVASQTLENMAVIAGGVEMQVLRPLLSFDKQEIVDLAKRIGTYDVSVRDYKDCCSILARHPETKARMEVVKELEQKINMERAVEEAIKLRQVVAVGPSGERRLRSPSMPTTV